MTTYVAMVTTQMTKNKMRNSLKPLTIFLGRLDVTHRRKSCLR